MDLKKNSDTSDRVLNISKTEVGGEETENHKVAMLLESSEDYFNLVKLDALESILGTIKAQSQV